MAEPDGGLKRVGSSQKVYDGCDGEIVVGGRRGGALTDDLLYRKGD